MRTSSRTTAICVKVTPSVERSILKPVSFSELMLQVRLMTPGDTVEAVRLVGAAGAATQSLARLEESEVPAALTAATW